MVVPPLRDRREDILELAHYFLACQGERAKVAPEIPADLLKLYEKLREDLQARGTVRLSEVEAEQKEILNTVRRQA